MSEQQIPLSEAHAELLAETLDTNHSATLGKLAAALAKAQLAFTPMLKESENPAFKRGDKVSKYADLHSLISSTRPALAANELVIIQSPSTSGKELVLTSLLLHSSGEWYSQELRLPAADDRGFTAHSIGKAITYARRYSWQSLTGATAEEDDDGNAASGVGSREAAQAVGEQKVKDLKAKKKDYVPALFYTWFNESQTAKIEGDQDLMTTHRELLKKYYQPAVKAVVVNAEQLEDLKYHFEKISVPFKLLKSVGENLTGQLEESLKQLKLKKTNGEEKTV